MLCLLAASRRAAALSLSAPEPQATQDTDENVAQDVITPEVWQRTWDKLARLQNASLPSEDPCKCQNWKHVYNSGAARCGRGLEYTFTGAETYDSVATYLPLPEYVQEPLDMGFGPQVCPMYHRVDNDFCLRTGRFNFPGKWYSSSWCYVSNACESSLANPVSYNGNSLKVKLCERPHDVIFSDLPIEAVVEFAQAMGFQAPGHFVDIVYPVESSIDIPMIGNNTDLIKKLRASGETVVIGGKTARYVISGERSWHLPSLGSDGIGPTPRIAGV